MSTLSSSSRIPLLTLPSEFFPEHGGNLWKRAAKTLRPKEFEALWLRYVENQNVATIARTLAVSKIYVRYLLFRARKKLMSRV